MIPLQALSTLPQNRGRIFRGEDVTANLSSLERQNFILLTRKTTQIMPFLVFSQFGVSSKIVETYPPVREKKNPQTIFKNKIVSACGMDL